MLITMPYCERVCLALTQDGGCLGTSSSGQEHLGEIVKENIRFREKRISLSDGRHNTCGKSQVLYPGEQTTMQINVSFIVKSGISSRVRKINIKDIIYL